MRTKYLLLSSLLLLLILIVGCQIQADEIYNFFSGKKNVLDYAVNCTVLTNISLDTINCVTPKRSIFVNYNDTWNEYCCAFDTRCQAINNTNVTNICSNVNTTYTYIGPVFNPSLPVAGSLCCNGEGQCFMDTTPLSNCTMINQTQMVATIAFNLTNTTEWDAICCAGGI